MTEPTEAQPTLLPTHVCRKYQIEGWYQSRSCTRSETIAHLSGGAVNWLTNLVLITYVVNDDHHKIAQDSCFVFLQSCD